MLTPPPPPLLSPPPPPPPGRTASMDESYTFLRQELPVRLANIMKEFRWGGGGELTS